MAICVFPTCHLNGTGCDAIADRGGSSNYYPGKVATDLKLATAISRPEFRRQQPRSSLLSRIECTFTKPTMTRGCCDISLLKPTSFLRKTLPSRQRQLLPAKMGRLLPRNSVCLKTSLPFPPPRLFLNLVLFFSSIFVVPVDQPLFFIIHKAFLCVGFFSDWRPFSTHLKVETTNPMSSQSQHVF